MATGSNDIKAASGRKNGSLRMALTVWLVSAFVLTAAALMAYTAAQQALRLSANSPQVQLARDGAAAIASGKPADAVAAGEKIDIARSLAPFVIVYDAQGTISTSSGLLNGQSPKIPSGVLDYAGKNGEDRVSWTPDKSVRIAAVVVKVEGGPGGYVLSGRSLEEAERTIGVIGRLMLALWGGSIAVMLAACLLYGLLANKK
jgi:hypothetical protein